MISYTAEKHALNLKKHGFDLVLAEEVLSGVTITREDSRAEYGETRLQTLGVCRGVVVFVVHTPRGDTDHIISLRKANRHEARYYWKHATGG